VTNPAPIPVILAAYDPAWPTIATRLIAQLNATSLFAAVHHIGSTSVPGLVAKPVIDLMPLVADLDTLDNQRNAIQDIGYTWHGEFGIPGRRYCKLENAQGFRVAQLHIFETSSPHVNRHLAFRDYLRAYPEIARAYEIEKYRARDLHPQSTHAYSDEKSAWIRNTEAAALAWFNALPQNAAARLKNHAQL
jgi:GrpB-like predicted nucleotidyltransferase (UPF0157 family)